MTKQTLKKGIVILSTSFPDKKFDGAGMWLLLSDLEDEHFLNAIIKVCRSEKELYPGTNIIALIREKALGHDNQLLAAEAFENLMTQVSNVGSYGNPVFKDKVTEKAVSAMGWKSICLSEISDRAILRSQFIKIYESFLERHKKEIITGETLPLIQNLVKQIANK